MKKLLILFLILCFTSTCAFCAVNSYDRHGSKAGSYRETTTGFNSYDKYGSKSGSYRKTSSGYNKYDKNGSKTGSYRKTTFGYNEYDKYGQKTGSYKINSNGVTTKYDQYGRKSGSFKKDSSGRVTEYDKYGRSAPLKRNIQIIEYADAVLAFWDGTSKGTKHVIDHCNKTGKKISVIII